jgi:hypothetical protein
MAAQRGDFIFVTLTTFPQASQVRPFACLFAIFKISGAHFCAVFSELLPISRQHAIDGSAYGFGASVLRSMRSIGFVAIQLPCP